MDVEASERAFGGPDRSDALAFGLRRCRSRPTLEWACAAARVSGHRHARAEDDMDVEELPLYHDGAADGAGGEPGGG